MPATVILGGQWGDEGKAKVVDYLMPGHDVVIRFQGGANAGHTVVNDRGTFKFHQIPSGILYPGVIGVLGNGMVVDPVSFLEELNGLTGRGVEVDGRLFISSAAQVVMPQHKFLDNLLEGERKKDRIGSTGKGIGPTYSDKHRRSGMRMSDFLLPREPFHALIEEKIAEGNRRVEIYGAPPLSKKQVAAEFMTLRDRIAPFIVDTQHLIHLWKGEGKKILLEGAQGTLLDIDHGTYPFVTSSNCTIGGALTGTGLGPRDIGTVVGIMKAYTTRVGNGPFPTELEDATGECLRERGGEFGTTTGRPRRCGWLDLVAARYAVMLNGFDEIALTKLDVLSGQDTIRVCVAYEVDGRRTEDFPQRADILERCTPVWEELPGWEDAPLGSGAFDSLPEAAREYVMFLERRLDVPITFVSTGPERESTIIRKQS
jgi:adenylosuccinate synthase